MFLKFIFLPLCLFGGLFIHASACLHVVHQATLVAKDKGHAGTCDAKWYHHVSVVRCFSALVKLPWTSFFQCCLLGCHVFHHISLSVPQVWCFPWILLAVFAASELCWFLVQTCKDQHLSFYISVNDGWPLYVLQQLFWLFKLKHLQKHKFSDSLHQYTNWKLYGDMETAKSAPRTPGRGIHKLFHHHQLSSMETMEILVWSGKWCLMDALEEDANIDG